MRTAKITIDGQEHLLCFSVRVILAINDRYGGMEHVDAALSGEDMGENLKEAIWLISTMMDAGARYARHNELANPEPLSCEDLYDLCGFEDFLGLRGKILETITRGREAHVEVETPKNGETTQGSSGALSGGSGTE